MIFNFTNLSYAKLNVQTPESRKKLMTRYKFCLMDSDAKRPGGVGRRVNPGTCGQRGRAGQKMAKFCGRLLWIAPYDIILENFCHSTFYVYA